MSVLVAAFLVAMPLMFVHPTAVILLVWFGLVVMAVAWPIEWVIQRFERKAAEKALQRHECPECGTTLEGVMEAGRVCEACGFEIPAVVAPAS